MTDGYLYCISNPNNPGILKIGKTRRDPSKRLYESNNFTFDIEPKGNVIEFAKKVKDFHVKEKLIHNALNHFRVQKNREFFKVDLGSVRSIFDLIDGDYWNTSKEKIKQESKEEVQIENTFISKEEVKLENKTDSVKDDQSQNKKIINHNKIEDIIRQVSGLYYDISVMRVRKNMGKFILSELTTNPNIKYHDNMTLPIIEELSELCCKVDSILPEIKEIEDQYSKEIKSTKNSNEDTVYINAMFNKLKELYNNSFIINVPMICVKFEYITERIIIIDYENEYEQKLYTEKLLMLQLYNEYLNPSPRCILMNIMRRINDRIINYMVEEHKFDINICKLASNNWNNKCNIIKQLLDHITVNRKDLINISNQINLKKNNLQSIRTILTKTEES
jgi:hypothetical protein